MILRTWFALLMAPICAVTSLVFAIQCFCQATWVKVPAQVAARYIKIETYHRRDGDVNIANLLVRFSYKVNGVNYTVIEDFGNAQCVKQSFSVGKPIDVYYEPGNPENARVGNCNSGKLGCVALGASLISALGFLFGMHTKKQFGRTAYL